MTAHKIVVRFQVNEKPVQIQTWPLTRLIDLLREELHLTGTKEGCGEGECGACSVLFNGQLINSCLIPAIQLEGSSITTIEGIASGKQLSTIQKSFLDHNGAQCGICSPGMILATVALLRKNKKPTRDEIREALAGNLCRCTGYEKIFDSIADACKQEGVV